MYRQHCSRGVCRVGIILTGNEERTEEVKLSHAMLQMRGRNCTFPGERQRSQVAEDTSKEKAPPRNDWQLCARGTRREFAEVVDERSERCAGWAGGTRRLHVTALDSWRHWTWETLD